MYKTIHRSVFSSGKTTGKIIHIIMHMLHKTCDVLLKFFATWSFYVYFFENSLCFPLFSFIVYIAPQTWTKKIHTQKLLCENSRTVSIRRPLCNFLYILFQNEVHSVIISSYFEISTYVVNMWQLFALELHWVQRFAFDTSYPVLFMIN